MQARRPELPSSMGIPPMTLTAFAHSIEVQVARHPDLPGQRLARILFACEGGGVIVFMPLEALAPSIRAMEDVQRHANTGIVTPRDDGRPVRDEPQA